MGGISAGDIAVVLALLTFAALHIFRSPNRQIEDLAGEIKALRSDLESLRRDHNALAVKLAGEHFTRAEIKEMLREMREAVDRVQGAVDRFVESQRTERQRHGRP